MFALPSLAALYGGWRIARSAWQLLRRLPRRNDDFLFF